MLLPLENNSTSVDPDLINDINKLPYAQRFRLIFNELGAGLAGRGADIEAAVKRANPALRDVDRLLGILNDQRDQLTQLAADSEQILEPLSRERAQRRRLLHQLRRRRPGERPNAARTWKPRCRSSPPSCASSARRCAACRASPTRPRRSSPTLGKAAPSFTEATRLLTPFSAASTVSLKSLGATGEEAGPTLRAADPIVRKTRDLAQTGANPTTKLAEFFASTKETKGFDAPRRPDLQRHRGRPTASTNTATSLACW